ncbi:complement component 1 Q subcomponent-binding protein, mitochondrial-like [Actinia tenebrosa]|uniref:Complement component 1 Q subcomponent-binding protein, mitochondrial-like n=1 Tax=Actinia tenebrosa TaxID=6105 RepID=A0A6P8H4V5_ACTTE|nr:complement component 1 Q subcomponent-binding protein, mitochondrial-like [Actinia tenebrosa]
MLSRVVASRATRAVLSCRNLIGRPSTNTRLWSVFSGLSATTRAVSQKPFLQTACACSKICACGAHKLTQGDSDLLGFLNDEIKFEKESAKDVPKANLFKANIDGTSVSLEREFNGERIVVNFDLNQNVNEDEAYVSENESDNEKDEAQVAGDIVSYPYFNVDIIKSTGQTLQFACEYNQGVLPKAEGAENEEEELFQIVNVTVLKSSEEAETKSLYAAETENFDPNLYTMLLNMLSERGVDDPFAHWLLEYSTALEHQHYIKFLQDLHGFIKQN